MKKRKKINPHKEPNLKTDKKFLDLITDIFYYLEISFFDDDFDKALSTYTNSINYLHIGNTCNDCKHNFKWCNCEYCEDCKHQRCICDLNISENKDDLYENIEKLRITTITLATKYLNYKDLYNLKNILIRDFYYFTKELDNKILKTTSRYKIVKNFFISSIKGITSYLEIKIKMV